MLFLLGYNLKIVYWGELTFGGGEGGDKNLVEGNFSRWEGDEQIFGWWGGGIGLSPSPPSRENPKVCSNFLTCV